MRVFVKNWLRRYTARLKCNADKKPERQPTDKHDLKTISWLRSQVTPRGFVKKCACGELCSPIAGRRRRQSVHSTLVMKTMPFFSEFPGLWSWLNPFLRFLAQFIQFFSDTFIVKNMARFKTMFFMAKMNFNFVPVQEFTGLGKFSCTRANIFSLFPFCSQSCHWGILGAP